MPAQGGSALGTPADGVTGFPHASITVGGVGMVAFAGHGTVEEPGGGSVNVDGSMV